MTTDSMEMAVVPRSDWLRVQDLLEQASRIHEAMTHAMKEGIHFGTIPGTKKPTIYKARAEKILMLFQLSADPIVEDLSNERHTRFRVKTNITHRATGAFVGSGLGECSSDEDKYQWRESICPEEWENTETIDRRVKYRRRYQGGYDTIHQIRTNHADFSNTILKMAVKRSVNDGTLRVSAASDIFSQDLEDMADLGFAATTEPPQLTPVATAAATVAPIEKIAASPLTSSKPAPERKRLESGVVYEGILREYDIPPGPKKTGRATFDVDGQRISATFFDQPQCMMNVSPASALGKAFQFSYIEKPGRNGGKLFTNLMHMALVPLPEEPKGDNVYPALLEWIQETSSENELRELCARFPQYDLSPDQLNTLADAAEKKRHEFK